MDQQDEDQSAGNAAHASSPFGRGWIPLSRDIGIPGERLARNQQYFAGEADNVGAGPLDAAAEDRRRLAEWVGGEGLDGGVVYGAAHPQPLPQAGGG